MQNSRLKMFSSSPVNFFYREDRVVPVFEEDFAFYANTIVS